MSVPKKYEGIIIGKGGNNKENIETKSGAKIIISRHNSEGGLIRKNVFVYITHIQTQKCLFSVLMKELDETQIIESLRLRMGRLTTTA